VRKRVLSCRMVKSVQIFYLIKKHISIFIKNIIYSDKLTYYPEEERKNRISIFIDNFIWILHFHHANEFYYILGFDRKNYTQYRQKYINGRQCRKIIERKKMQVSNNSKIYDIVIHDKFIAAQYMESLGFPVPSTIAVVYNNKIILPKSDEEFPLNFIITEKKSLFEDCICKPIADWAGRGIFRMQANDGNIIINNRNVTKNKFKDLFSNSKYIIQEKIIQHEKMSKLNPNSINTIRLVTCFDNQTVQPFSAGVRIGMEGNITDNWHTGGILVRLNIESGLLDKYGFTHPEHSGKKYERHPETGVKFDSYEIPYCHKAIDLATNLHKYFYNTHSIGWDIAITKEGPVFIEANQGWDPYIHLVLEDNFLDKFYTYFK